MIINYRTNFSSKHRPVQFLEANIRFSIEFQKQISRFSKEKPASKTRFSKSGYFDSGVFPALFSITRTSPALSMVFPLGIILSSPLWMRTSRLPSCLG